ncbi:hypothetical protein A3Q56_07932, partial [Intoshia linei]
MDSIITQPDYIKKRNELFNNWKADYDKKIEELPKTEIQVKLPDDSMKYGTSFLTTPMDIALQISKSLASSAILSKVDGEKWDLMRPLEKDCSLELLKMDHEEAMDVFWHSSAHIMGECVEMFYQAHVVHGPPVKDGFFYDFQSKTRNITQTDYPEIEKLFTQFTREKQPFERLELSKEQLLELFSYNKYKTKFIDEKVTGKSTVYRCGTFIDFCRGPHIPNNKLIGSICIYKSGCSYWQGNPNLDQLQRLYGISFKSRKELVEWKKFREEADKRSHRVIGRDQQLFMFNDLSPGSAFFLPHGTHIYNRLVSFLRKIYWKRNYKEVITPNIFNTKLFQTSGHYQHYDDNMFSFKVDNEMFSMKPMNCPSHCLIFKSRMRSWRELPLKIADFGALHRNEFSGALHGLTRVRRFAQDDAHIFCTLNQLKSVINECIDFVKEVYDIFEFEFFMELSTRPEKYMGSLGDWNSAEKHLEEALNLFGGKWKFNHGDGAFYGPKIDIKIKDALKREHQCATIQVDFQQPKNFDLKYLDDESMNATNEPVIVHRAILGSIERFFGILCEHTGGKWPFWISPRQAIIVPISPELNNYALE